MKPGNESTARPAIAIPPSQATASDPTPANQTIIGAEPETPAVIEANGIGTTVSQEEPAMITVQTPVIPSYPGRIAPRHRHPGFSPHSRPPESALEGCRGKQRGDACEDKNRPGDIRGVCHAPRADDDLACVPIR
ncbi:MAG: hypothetical protein PHR16_08415 [Methylovulum sp.]|nr:hypothetical protein [Methylovulum sp.]